MKTISISIKVPNWFPTSHDFRSYKRKFVKWIFPSRCVDCNKRLKTNSFYWKHYRTGTHPLGIKDTMTTFAIRATRPSCPSCMKKYLHQHPNDIGNCIICETKDVPVMGYTVVKEPKNVITFLWHWWNGSTFCMKCIDELLDSGQPATDVYITKTINGKRVMVPEFY